MSLLDEDPQDNANITTACAKLAELLRKSGSRILTNSAALSLTWPVFHRISTALSLVSSRTSETEQALDEKLLLDLEYLKSFLHRVPHLHLHHTVESDLTGWIQLDGLQYLRHLHLKRLPIHLVRGFASIRPQITSLQVSRCTFTIEDLLSDCLGDDADPGEWTSLSRLGLQSNGLKQLSHALQLAPNLQVLDCSHNQVTDTAGVYELPALTSVNISYNLLTAVPDFQPQCSHTLTVLSLAYNHLETLAGLEQLISLVHLDVSSNCLMHHDVLSPLSSLPKLQVLHTLGNPLSTHPRHRLKCCAWLHSCLLPTQPVLDDVQLSRTELAMVGTNRVIVTPPVSPINENDLDLPLPKSASRSGSVEGSLVSGYTSASAAGGARRKKGKSSKRRRVREAVIAEPTDHDLETTATEGETSEVPDTGDATEKEHLTTATKLQMLRETFGEEDWMRAQAGDQLHQLLGLEIKPGPDTSTIIADLMSRDIAKTGSVSSNHEEASAKVLQSTPIKESSVESQSKESPVVTTDITRPLEKSLSPEGGEGDVSKRLSEMSNSFYSVYKRSSNTSTGGGMDRSHEGNVGEEGGSRISVDRVIPGDDSGAPGEKLHLFVTSEFIREQTEEGTTRVKWFLHSLEACEMLSTSGGLVTAHFLFNTVRRDRRDRTYTMADASYSILMAVVGPVLEAAATAAAALPSLQCVKCQSMFTHDTEARSRRSELRCPNCGSTMVIEADNKGGEYDEAVAVGIPVCEALDLESIAGAERASCTPEPEVSRGSQPENTYLGVDAGNTLNTLNTSISPIPGTLSGHAVQVTADIHDHVVNSADTHLPDLLPRPEPSNCGDNSHVRQMSSSPSGGGILQRSESSSDISVLSNPSESSIEVLTCPSVRRQLTPERPKVVTEAVTPVKDAKQVENMVESSSSGSLVNSVVLNLSKEEEKEDAVESPVKEERSEEERRSDEGDKSREDLTSVEDESMSSVYLSCDDTGASVVNGTTLDDTRSSTFLESDNDETTNTLHNDNADTVLDTTLSDCDVTNEEDGDSALATPVDKEEKFLEESPVSSEVEPVIKDDTSNNLALMKSVMSWNYDDFSIADHRVQLFCELSIFKEPEEDLLIIAKGGIHIKSTPGIFTGVLLVSNRRIYVLKVTKSESEEPSDWLEVVCSSPVSRLERLVYLLGGQGVGLELAGVEAKPATPSFLTRAQGTGYVGGEGADCYYIIVKDEDRTERLVEQLVDRLMEMVRGTPIPVTRLTQDEEVLLKTQLEMRGEGQVEAAVKLFLLVSRIDADGGARSMIVTKSHVFLATDFFEWIFQTDSSNLIFQNSFPIEDINQMSIYQSWPERVCLDLGEEKLELRLETERGVQRLVKALRGPWEEHHGKALEECISFHPTGSGRVLRMQTMLMEDSITFADFDLSQWIKVTSDKSAKAT